MQFKNFDELIEQVFELCQLPDAHLVSDNAILEIDDIIFVLKDSGTEAEAAFEYHCDFGDPPKAQRDEVLATLLAINGIMPFEEAQRFSIDAETGRVMLSGRMKADDTTVADVMTALAGHAAQAKIWRETYYLQDHNPLRKNAARSKLENRLAGSTRPA